MCYNLLNILSNTFITGKYLGCNKQNDIVNFKHIIYINHISITSKEIKKSEAGETSLVKNPHSQTIIHRNILFA